MMLHLPRFEDRLGTGWEEHPRRVLVASAAHLGRSAEITDDPDEADVVLFTSVAHTGLWMHRILGHPEGRRHRAKVMVYSEADHPWPWLPGIYAAVPRPLYDGTRHRTGPYISFHHTFGLGGRLARIAPMERPAHLYSFIGSAHSAPRLRGGLLGLVDDRALLVDTSGERWAPFYGSADDRAGAFDRFVTSIASSAFVLCPRGSGPGTMRVFEAMAAGRVPVILSDHWVPPSGPVWDRCAVVVSEADWSALPQLLRGIEASAPELGARARTEWERWFATDVLFASVSRWCDEIRAVQRPPARRSPARLAWTVRNATREVRSPIRPRSTDRPRRGGRRRGRRAG